MLLILNVHPHMARGSASAAIVHRSRSLAPVANLRKQSWTYYSLGHHRLGIRRLVLESSDGPRIMGFVLTLWSNAWKALDAVEIGDSLKETSVRVRGCEEPPLQQLCLQLNFICFTFDLDKTQATKIDMLKPWKFFIKYFVAINKRARGFMSCVK